MDEAKRDEHRDQTSTERGSDSEEHSHAEEASRRAFIRKSAEAGVLSLFGVMGLDALAEEVLARLNERTATRELAGVVGDLLHEAGIGALAFAAEGCSCPEGMGGPNFACAADHVPPFTCPQDFSCQPQHNFQCSPFHFECPTTGKTPPFKCSTAGQDPTFSCTDGYLCPGQGKFWPCPCTDTKPFNQAVCRTPTHTANYMEKCLLQLDRCPPAGRQDLFQCNVSAQFVCGNEHYGTSGFVCETGKFICNGGTLYDHACITRFDCQGNVECRGNHIFTCHPGSYFPNDFNCDTGGSFTCAAGGALCNEPGTGNYEIPGGPGGDQRPGDFYCLGSAGADNDFDCRTAFSCASVDDFVCRGVDDAKNFECASGEQFKCEPQAGGDFRCNPEDPGGFTCGGTTFQCQQPHPFRPNYT